MIPEFRQSAYAFCLVFLYTQFIEKAGGSFAFVGGGFADGSKNFPHHHGMFDIDEDSLRIGAALYAQYALDFCSER